MSGPKTRFSIAKPGTLKCNYCGRLLKTFSVYIGCASPECLKDEVKHCVDCFSVGAHLLPHLPNHPYTVVPFNEEDPEIYEAGWTVKEEIALLNSISNHGLHKWRSVARAVPRKTPKSCEDHFNLLNRILKTPAEKEKSEDEVASGKFMQ